MWSILHPCDQQRHIIVYDIAGRWLQNGFGAHSLPTLPHTRRGQDNGRHGLGIGPGMTAEKPLCGHSG